LKFKVQSSKVKRFKKEPRNRNQDENKNIFLRETLVRFKVSKIQSSKYFTKSIEIRK